MESEKGELEYYFVAAIGTLVIGFANKYGLGILGFCGLIITSVICLYIALTKFPRKDK